MYEGNDAGMGKPRSRKDRKSCRGRTGEWRPGPCARPCSLTPTDSYTRWQGPGGGAIERDIEKPLWHGTWHVRDVNTREKTNEPVVYAGTNLWVGMVGDSSVSSSAKYRPLLLRLDPSFGARPPPKFLLKKMSAEVERGECE